MAEALESSWLSGKSTLPPMSSVELTEFQRAVLDAIAVVRFLQHEMASIATEELGPLLENRHPGRRHGGFARSVQGSRWPMSPTVATADSETWLVAYLRAFSPKTSRGGTCCTTFSTTDRSIQRRCGG